MRNAVEELVSANLETPVHGEGQPNNLVAGTSTLEGIGKLNLLKAQFLLSMPRIPRPYLYPSKCGKLRHKSRIPLILSVTPVTHAWLYALSACRCVPDSTKTKILQHEPIRLQKS